MSSHKKQGPSIINNFIYNSLYQVLLIAIPLISTPYVSRVLGADGTGIYSFTLSNQTYFSMLAALGTISYGTREISIRRDNRKDLSKTFWEIELLTIVTTIICCGIWFLFILLSSNYKIYYFILTINIIAVAFDISWLYAGLEEFKYTVIQNGLFKIISLVLIFLLVKTKDDLWIYVSIMSLSVLLGNISMWIYMPRFVERVPFKSLSIKKHFKETIVYFIPTIATSVYTVLDKSLLGFLGTDIKENGYYEQATKIINLSKALAFTSLNAVLGTRISYLFSNGKLEEIKSRIELSVNYILLIGWALVFGIFAVVDEFVPIYYGPGYEKVGPLIIIMSPLIIIIGISNCLGTQYYTPAGLRKKSAQFIIIGAAINLLLNLVLIPKFQSTGAIIATIIAELVISGLYLRYCNRMLEIKTLLKYSYKRVICGIIMLLAVYCASAYIPKGLVGLCFKVIIGASTYVLSLFILKDSFLKMCISKIGAKFKNG